MKKKLIFGSLLLFTVLAFASCKKCQECSIATTQEVLGVEQTITVTQEYCGSEYDDAPAEGTVTNGTGSNMQTVTISCQDS